MIANNAQTPFEPTPIHRVAADVVCGVFNAINKAVFDDDHLSRFTLFLPSPSHPDRIVPWCRFFKGCSDPFVEAQRSKASYQRGEGYTGMAWKDPETFLTALFPRFESRADFTQYYSERLGLANEVIQDISDYMVNVQTIITYGFIDCQGMITGVLSLDVQRLIGEINTEQSPLGRKVTTEIFGIEVQQLRPFIAVLNILLESLQILKRR